MKSAGVVITCLLLLLSFCFPGCSDDAYASLEKDLQDLLDRVVLEKNVPGIGLQIVDSRQGEWALASGTADIGEGTPMDPAYRFRCGSVTKTFTAAGIMLLQQDGLLELDDPISEYVPDLHIPLDSVITVRDLLAHRSGMVDYVNETDYVARILLEDPLHSFTPQELVQVSIDAGSNFYPGTQFRYCNTGILVAALVIEKANAKGLTYADFIRTQMLEPLGLTDTFVPTDWRIPGKYAHGYLYSEEKGFEDFTVINQSCAYGCGNMVSTLGDLAHWARALYKGQVVSQALTDEMMDVIATGDEDNPYYGLGCTYTPGLGYGHNGETLGYLTMMRYDPDDDIAMVTYTNKYAFHLLSDVLYDVAYSAKRILGYDVP